MAISIRVSNKLTLVKTVTTLLVTVDLFFVQSFLVVATPTKSPVDKPTPKSGPGFGNQTEFASDSTLWTSISSKGTIEDRQRLINKLLNEKPGYDVTNYPTNFTVQFGISIFSLTVNGLPRQNLFQTSVLTQTLWSDPRLQWDPSEYGGHSVISLPSNLVWKPSIKLLRSASAPSIDDCADANVLVASNGQVLWTTPCQYLVECDLTGDYNGKKTCSLVFGSWATSAAGASMDLQFYKNKSDFDNTFFTPSPEIKIIASTAARVEIAEQSFSEMLPVQLIYVIKFERRSDVEDAGSISGAQKLSPGASIDCSEGERMGPDGTCAPAATFER